MGASGSLLPGPNYPQQVIAVVRDSISSSRITIHVLPELVAMRPRIQVSQQ